MAEVVIIYWRDIPGQVIAQAGRKRARQALDDRFQAAIDRAAMRAKKHGAEDYIAEWRRGDPKPCSDDLEAEATAAATDIEAAYPKERLEKIIKAAGIEEEPGT